MSAMLVTKNNFKEEVLESNRKVLVDFFAPWCGPCRMVGPVIDEIAQQRTDIKVVKVNVDEDAELASQFQVMSIPTLVVIENSQVLTRSTGAKGKDAILEMLEA